MFKIFFLFCNFFTMYLICAQLSPSLNQLIMGFEQLKKNYQNNVSSLRCLNRYQKACEKAEGELKNENKITPNIWYRVALAGLIYSLGFDKVTGWVNPVGFQIFKQNIEPLLYNWAPVKKGIQRIDYLVGWHGEYLYDMLKQLPFFNLVYKTYQVYHSTGVLEQGYIYKCADSPRFDLFEKMPSEDPGKFYYTCQEDNFYKLYLKSENDTEGPGKCLLVAPSSGVVFVGGSCYGLLDYINKEAFICKRSNNETTMIDFKNDIPWPEASNFKNVSWFFRNPYLVLVFNLLNSQFKQVFYYKFIDKPDLSTVSSYYE